MTSKKAQFQRHKNVTGYKNDLHDTSKRWRDLNKWTISGVCARCKDAIEWKIRYKKYKTMTQPKSCVRCGQKTVTQSYCTVCTPCSQKLGQCKKCGQQTDIVAQPEMTEVEKARQDQDLNDKLKSMSERQRRSYKRAVERGETPTLKHDDIDSDSCDDLSDSDEEDT